MLVRCTHYNFEKLSSTWCVSICKSKEKKEKEKEFNKPYIYNFSLIFHNLLILEAFDPLLSTAPAANHENIQSYYAIFFLNTFFSEIKKEKKRNSVQKENYRQIKLKTYFSLEDKFDAILYLNVKSRKNKNKTKLVTKKKKAKKMRICLQKTPPTPLSPNFKWEFFRPKEESERPYNYTLNPIQR